jgi:hypothetical protein
MSDWTYRSLKMTAICIVDRVSKIVREGVVASDPEAIAAFIKLHAPHVVRIGLETGATSTWLWTELHKMRLPVICIDARHAKAALKMRRARPYRGENNGPGKDVHGGLDPTPGIREQPGPTAAQIKVRFNVRSWGRKRTHYARTELSRW